MHFVLSGNQFVQANRVSAKRAETRVNWFWHAYYKHVRYQKKLIQIIINFKKNYYEQL